MISFEDIPKHYRGVYLQIRKLNEEKYPSVEIDWDQLPAGLIRGLPRYTVLSTSQKQLRFRYLAERALEDAVVRGGIVALRAGLLARVSAHEEPELVYRALRSVDLTLHLLPEIRCE